MDEYQWIEGAVAVEAVLQSGSRDVAAVAVRQDRYDSAAARVQQLARAAGLVPERLPAAAIAERLPGGAASGIIAYVGPRRLVALDDLLAGPWRAGWQPAGGIPSRPTADGPGPGHEARLVLVMLDGVEDPFNFGQAVRSLYAAGIDGLIVRPRNWLSAAATVIRASAGAGEWLPTAAAEVDAIIAAARAHALPIAIADADGQPMHEVDLTGPLLLVIGGEKRGVARPLQQAAAARVSIPYGRQYPHSLGIAAAAAVLAFEVARQRRARGE